jgi:hypothetical protein
MECSGLDFACHAVATWDIVLQGFKYIFGLLLSSLAFVLSYIPVPSWMQNVSFSIPSGVLWFASALELPFGASVMAGAWGSRFIIRRLPFIG